MPLVRDLHGYVDHQVLYLHDYVDHQVLDLHDYVDYQVLDLHNYIDPQVLGARGGGERGRRGRGGRLPVRGLLLAGPGELQHGLAHLHLLPPEKV